MKVKIFSLIIGASILMAACAPAAVVEEPVAEPEINVAVEEEQAMEDESAMVEEEQAMEDESAMVAEVSFSGDIWLIIEQYALNAHGGKGGVFLESYEDIMEYVVPGDPEGSKLYQALTATGGVPQMPPSGPLPDEMIQLFYDWIEQGAPNN